MRLPGSHFIAIWPMLNFYSPTHITTSCSSEIIARVGSVTSTLMAALGWETWRPMKSTRGRLLLLKALLVACRWLKVLMEDFISLSEAHFMAHTPRTWACWLVNHPYFQATIRESNHWRWPLSCRLCLQAHLHRLKSTSDLPTARTMASIAHRKELHACCWSYWRW